MAKEDFCFTYYDGDAARDMAHMNRLERGAYGDIIVSQRKFGRLSLKLIKKTLGNDFEAVWEALEIILKLDEQGNYFIEWLDTSIEKMRRQSLHQSQNGKKGGRPKTQTKANQNPNENPNETQTISPENPLEDGDGYEYILDVIKQLENTDIVIPESEQKNYVMLVVEMIQIFLNENPEYFFHKETDYPACLQIAYKIAEMKKWKRDSVLNINKDPCLQSWKTIVLFIKTDDWLNGRSLSDLNTVKEWQRLVQKMQKQNNGTHKQTSKPSKDQGAKQLTGLLRSDLQINAGAKQGNRA